MILEASSYLLYRTIYKILSFEVLYLHLIKPYIRSFLFKILLFKLIQLYIYHLQDILSHKIEFLDITEYNYDVTQCHIQQQITCTLTK